MGAQHELLMELYLGELHGPVEKYRLGVELEMLRSLNGFQAYVTENCKAQSVCTWEAQDGDRCAFFH